jgi:hypothetical protein
MQKHFASVVLGASIVLGGCHAEMSVDPPSKVVEAFKRDHPGASVNHVERESQSGGDSHYEYSYTDSNGNKKKAEYDAQGNSVNR